MNLDAVSIPDNYKGIFSLNSINYKQRENIIGNKEYLIKKIDSSFNYTPGSSSYKSITNPSHINL
jgi:hypothetical protein